MIEILKEWKYWKNQVKAYSKLADEAKIDLVKAKDELEKFKREHSQTLGQRTKLKNERDKFKEEKIAFYKSMKDRFQKAVYGMLRIEDFVGHDDDVVNSYMRSGKRMKIADYLFYAKGKVSKEDYAFLEVYGLIEETIDKTREFAIVKQNLINSNNEKENKIEELELELADVKLLMRQIAQDPATDRLIKKLKRTVQ